MDCCSNRGPITGQCQKTSIHGLDDGGLLSVLFIVVMHSQVNILELESKQTVQVLIPDAGLKVGNVQFSLF